LEPALSFPQRLACVQAFSPNGESDRPCFKCSAPAGCISVAHCWASPLHLVELRKVTIVSVWGELMAVSYALVVGCRVAVYMRCARRNLRNCQWKPFDQNADRGEDTGEARPQE
jgi:hypothetical protein